MITFYDVDYEVANELKIFFYPYSNDFDFYKSENGDDYDIKIGTNNHHITLISYIGKVEILINNQQYTLKRNNFRTITIF